MVRDQLVRRVLRLLVSDTTRLTQTAFAKHFARACRDAKLHPSNEVVVEAAPLDELPRGWFIADRDTFLCGDCNAHTNEYDVGLDRTEVWEWFSHGWLGPVVCRRCKLSIPVVIDGEAPAGRPGVAKKEEDDGK